MISLLPVIIFQGSLDSTRSIHSKKITRSAFATCALDIGQVSVNTLQYGAAIRIGVRPEENTFSYLFC
jgi:hypothetical protein